MKRWTATWAALVVAGFLATPGFAQTPATPAAPTAQEKTATPEQSAQGTPQQHLQEASAAVNSISGSAVTGKAKSQIAELKKHLNSIEKITAKDASASADVKASASGSAKWAADAAAADKILGEMLADSPATGGASAAIPSEPQPTGTSGRVPSKATAAVAIDDETKAKLTTARASLTAFAAAMSGAAPATASAAATPSAEPAHSMTSPPATTSPAEPAAPPSASPASPAPTSPAPASPAPASPAEPSPASPAPAPPASPDPSSPASPASPAPTTQPAEPTPTQPPAATSPTPPPAATDPAQPPATTQAQADPAATNADAATAKAALTAARDSLSQMTQLPAAQQLTGENRTQVSQLIANFNELITTNAEWKASYAKVNANLSALIGPQTTDEPPAAPAAPAAGAAGAVGTSGTAATTLDPAVKAKLVEFRTHLKEFERAAGGAEK